MKKGKYLRLENVELNAERALLAVIHLCHVWAPMHEYMTKLGKKQNNCMFHSGMLFYRLSNRVFAWQRIDTLLSMPTLNP